MSPQWIEYKGANILYIDYRLLSQRQIVERIYAAAEIVGASENGVLVLSDFRDVPIGMAILEEMQELGKGVFSDKTIKSAILGVTGIKKFLLNVYTQFSKDNVVAFNSYEEALEYLVEG
jgi:hypothetical protein